MRPSTPGSHSGSAVLPYSAILDSATEGAWMLSAADYTPVYVNQRLCEMLGRTEEEILHQPLSNFLDESTGALSPARLDRRRQGASEQYEAQLRRKDGSTLPVLVSARSVFDDQGRLVALVGTATDLSPLHEAKQALERQARQDDLTGLFNRTGFQRHLETLVRTGEARRFMVVVFRLEGLAEMADSFGQDCLDELIRQLAARLRIVALSPEGCARLSEHELAAVFPGRNAALTRALAEKAVLLLEQPVFTGGNPLEVLANAGIASFPDHGDVGAVLRRASLAADKARELGETLHVFAFEHGGYGAAIVRISSELRRGLEAGQLTLHYQPKLSLASGGVTGVEALARWHHPTQGLITPEHFIYIAEQSRLIRRLGQWALDAAGRQVREWRDYGQPLRVAVNLSMRDLQDPQLADSIELLLTRYNLSGQELIVEITETALMTNPTQALEALRRLAELGIATSIDDFGTGYSSLAYLAKLPVSEIKIDQSFIGRMLDNQSDEIIVRTIIELGHALGVEVVAEGVETAEIRQVLADFGCDTIQGFHVARPMPAAAMAGWLRSA